MLDFKQSLPFRSPSLAKSFSFQKQTLPCSSRTKITLQNLQSDLIDLKQTLMSFRTISDSVSLKVLNESVLKEVRLFCERYEMLIQGFEGRCRNFQVALVNLKYYQGKDENKIKQKELLEIDETRKSQIRCFESEDRKDIDFSFKNYNHGISLNEPVSQMLLPILEPKHHRSLSSYKYETTAPYSSTVKYQMIDQHKLLENKFKNLLLKQRYNKYKNGGGRSEKKQEREEEGRQAKRNRSDLLINLEVDEQEKAKIDMVKSVRTPRVKKRQFEDFVSGIYPKEQNEVIKSNQISKGKAEEVQVGEWRDAQTPEIISTFLSSLRSL